MSKRAEEAALEAYPVDICGYRCKCEIGDKPEPLDYNERKRIAYQEGYEQAEKDLALTADDIGAILELYLQMMRDKKYRDIGREALCDEVLKRFYELDKNE